MTRSTPCQKLVPPEPWRDQSEPRFAWSSAHQVRYTSEAATAQTATRRTHRRTNAIGPASANTVVTTPKRSVQNQWPDHPKTRRESALAAVAITISSKDAQPRFCATLSAVARYEPRC